MSQAIQNLIVAFVVPLRSSDDVFPHRVIRPGEHDSRQRRMLRLKRVFAVIPPFEAAGDVCVIVSASPDFVAKVKKMIGE